MTASPYLGLDSVEPFLAACRRHGAGVFFLVRTSNAGAADVQDLALSDGRPLWHHVAELVREWGEPLVGESGDVERRRGRRCDASARGLRGAAAAPAVADPAPRRRRAGRDAGRRRPRVHAGPASALVTASRSVIFAYRESEADWRAAAAAEAQRLAAQVWAAAGW